MWTRLELKNKAKASLKANYWKAVLVAVLVAVLAGGTGGFASVGDTSTIAALSDSFDDGSNVVEIESIDDLDGLDDWDDVEGYWYDEDDGTYYYTYDDASSSTYENVMAGIGIFTVGMVVLAIALAGVFLVCQPMLVGGQRFFLRNLNQKAEVKEIAYAFDNNYLEVVKTMFFRALFTVLWSLLFIVPGIVKSYEYRMIPYLLAENPTMTKEVAFAESKRMMDGQKWNAFVLDLSFLGWNLLGACTLGILTVLYVAPYQQLTNAALYERLRYGQPAPAPQAQATGGQPPVYPVGGAPVQPAYPADATFQQPAVRYAQPQQPAQYAQSQQPVQYAQPQQTHGYAAAPTPPAGVPVSACAPTAAVADWPATAASATVPMQPAVAVNPAAPVAAGAQAVMPSSSAAVPFAAAAAPATLNVGSGSQPPMPPYAASAAAPYPNEIVAAISSADEAMPPTSNVVAAAPDARAVAHDLAAFQSAPDSAITVPEPASVASEPAPAAFEPVPEAAQAPTVTSGRVPIPPYAQVGADDQPQEDAQAASDDAAAETTEAAEAAADADASQVAPETPQA